MPGGDRGPSYGWSESDVGSSGSPPGLPGEAAAGGCGLGALQAAKERNAWGIGVDNDQSFLGSYILTSATKKVDVAVFDTIQQVVDGDFEGGGNTLYDVANEGVGYSKVSAEAPDRDALIEKLDDVSKQIADGDIEIPRE